MHTFLLIPKIFYIINAFRFSCSTVSKYPEDANFQTTNGLWTKYGKHDFMHDLEHLKEEASKVLYMQQEEKISVDQSAFYYTKLHDFNNDGKLDGLELLLAVKHSLVHSNTNYTNANLEDLAGFVDSELTLMDLNNDGFVDYGEIYTYIDKAKANPQTKTN